MAAINRIALAVWHWWTFVPPPPLGYLSERWILDFSYRAGVSRIDEP